MQIGGSEGKRVTLLIGVSREDSAPTVTVDGTISPFIGKTSDAYCLHPRKMSSSEEKTYADVDFYAYEVAPSGERNRDIVLVGDDVTVRYLELKVEDK